MKRLASSPQVAAFTNEALAILAPERDVDAAAVATAEQHGDVLEVSGTDAHGKRVVLKTIPLGKTFGNRRSRRASLARIKRA